MPEVHVPKAGSLQYWPRNRASRIYPQISLNASDVKIDGVKPLFFPAYKAGMTQAMVTDDKKGSPSYNQPVATASTVLDSPPIFVLGVRSYIRSGRNLQPETDFFADNIPNALGDWNSEADLEDLEADGVEDVRLIVATQPAQSGLGKKAPEVMEVDLSGSLEDKVRYAKDNVGLEIEMMDVFGEGHYADVTGVTKGHGFQGVVKRYGVTVRGRKDEQHHRQIGVIGTEGVGRVIYTVPQPGQMGFHQRTEFNKQVLEIGEGGFAPEGGFVHYGEVPDSYTIVRGSVPGPRKRLVLLRAPMRAPVRREEVSVRSVSQASQQGVARGVDE